MSWTGPLTREPSGEQVKRRGPAGAAGHIMACCAIEAAEAEAQSGGTPLVAAADPTDALKGEPRMS